MKISTQRHSWQIFPLIIGVSLLAIFASASSASALDKIPDPQPQPGAYGGYRSRSYRRGGYGGELSAIIAEEMFDYLDGPVVRIGALDSPVPFAPVLEQLYIPNSKDIVKAVREMA